MLTFQSSDLPRDIINCCFLFWLLDLHFKVDSLVFIVTVVPEATSPNIHILISIFFFF